MADTVTYQSDTLATPAAATIVATDDAGAAGHVQIIKLAISTDGSATVIPADAANGLDVDVTRVGGTVAVTQSGTWDEVGINDSGNSITVDGPLTDTELRASAVVVSDGSGSLTVDGTVAATQSGTWNVGTVTAVTGITNPVAVTDNSGSLTVDNAGTFAVQAAQSGTWDVGTVAAVTSITNAVAVTDNSSTLSVDDGAGSLTIDGTVTANLAAGTNNIGDVDVLTVPAPLSTTGGGTEATALRVTIATDSTGVLSIDDNGAAITVDGTVIANAGTNLNTSALALETGGNLAASATSLGLIDNSVDGNYLNVNLNVAGTDVAANAGVLTAQTLRVTIATDDEVNNLLGTIDADTSSLAGCVGGTELQVDIVASLPAGTNAIGKLAANSGVDIGDVDITSIAAGDNNIGNVDIVTGPTGANALQVQGTVAHDSAAAQNPVLLGATAANSAPTAVSNADVVRLIADLTGRQIVKPYSPPEKDEKYTSPSDITDTADDEAFAAVASVKHYITHFSAMCSHASTATWVYLKDGSTVIASIYCAAAGGGGVLTFPTPIAGTANTAINVANATNSSATRVNVVGFQAP